MKTIEEAKDDCILNCGCLKYRESDYTAGYANGVDYGFIGGSSFKYNRNTLVFTGNIKLHPDYESIKSFAQNYNVELLSLTENTMIDIGSIIPIDW